MMVASTIVPMPTDNPRSELGTLPAALYRERLAAKNSTSGRGDLTIYPDHFLTHESGS